MNTEKQLTGECNLQAARALIEVLGHGCTRHVVLSPGARSAPLVQALDESDRLRVHVVIDERVAAFVALGLAMATGRAAVLVCTSGSAAGHYLPAVMEAWHSRVPLFVVTADRPDECQHLGSSQTTEQGQLFFRHVRGCRRLPTPRADAQRQAIEEAWRVHALQLLACAEGDVPGPVHANAPFAEPLLPEPPLALQGRKEWSSQMLAACAREPDASGYSALSAFVAAHPTGVMVCGPMPSGEHAAARSAAIGALAQRLGWPIVADPLSGMRFAAPPEHPATVVVHRYDALLAHGFKPPPCDGVLYLGAQATSKALQQWLSQFAGHVAAVAALEQALPVHSLCALQFAGDIGATVRGLCQRLPKTCARDEEIGHVALWRAWQNEHKNLPAGDPKLLEPATVWPAVLAAMPAGSGLHVGSSMPIRDLDRFGGSSFAKDLRITSSRGLNGIDGTLATSYGLCLADPRPWLTVLGDITFLHDVAALQHCRGLNVAPTFLLLNNGGGQIFSRLPLARHQALFERYFLTPQQANMAALVKACCCSHEVVYSPAALATAIARALGDPKRYCGHVIEAHLAQPESAHAP